MKSMEEQEIAPGVINRDASWSATIVFLPDILLMKLPTDQIN